MGIASFSGASSVIKPGVVTSSTRPSSPFVGQLIYETDTARVAAYNGSAWIVQTGGLVLVKTQTIGTAVSTVTVSDAFSATYDGYKIMISGGVASAAAEMRMQFGATTTGYEYGLFSGGESGVNSDGSASSSAISIGDCDTNLLKLNADIINPFLAKYTHATGSAYVDSANRVRVFGGFVPNTTSYTSFTLFPASGTLTGGTIRVYGYANS